MMILIDTREQKPYSFNIYQAPTERVTLSCGDYSLAGFADRIAIERKSLDDLIGCLTGKDRTRFERELARAGSYERFAVVIESEIQDVSAGRYKSKMKPHAVLQSITAFYIRYGVPFLFCGNRDAAEYTTFWTLQKYYSEIEKRFENLQKNNQIQDRVSNMVSYVSPQ